MQPNRVEIYRRAFLVLAGLAITAFAGYVACWMLWSITRPYPIEYRENMVVLTTALMQDGLNPYALEQQPAFINLYGIGYHWIAGPLSHLFGAGFLFHRVLSCLFLLASCAVLVFGMRHEGTSWPWSLAAGLILFGECGQGLSIAARPDSLGLLLLLLSLYLPLRFSRSATSLFGSGACSIFAFFVKPYFIFGLPLVALHLILTGDRKKAFAFILITILIFSFLIMGMHAAYPAYFTNTFFVHINLSNWSFGHLKVYLRSYTYLHMGFLMLVAAPALTWGIRKLQPKADSSGSHPAPGQSEALESKVQPSPDTQESVTGEKGDLPLLALICGGIAIVARLGWHSLNGILYYHQLITPFLLWVAFRWADRRYKSSPAALLAVGLSMGLLLNNLPAFSPDSTQAWLKLEKKLDAYEHVYHCPLLAHWAYKREGAQGRIYNVGHTEYYSYGYKHNFLAVASELKTRGDSFIKNIQSGTRHGAFDALVLTKGFHSFVPYEELPRHYQKSEEVLLPMPFGHWRVEVWQRRPKSPG